ncbi:hypothetical protein IT417_01570 [bacterium]|nr:hypothetical protein [bacterium]
MISLETIQNKLSSYSEWKDIAERTPPFLLELYGKNQKLFFFGANHSRNPKDPQYIHLREFWDKFLLDIERDKSIVFVESAVRALKKTETEAIHADSEAGLMSFYANTESLKITSPELPMSEQFHLLSSKFGKDLTAFYFFFRVIPQYHRRVGNKVSFEEYIEKFLKKYKNLSNWDEYDFSIENMKQLHLQFLGNELNIDDIDFINKIKNPLNNDSPLLEINRESTRIRDLSILKNTYELWTQGYSLFMVFGASHLFLQKKALNSLVNGEV